MTTALTALLVEDDPLQNATIAALLEAAGFECGKATTGAEAISALTSKAYDLIVVDWVLPDVNGSELIASLNSTPHGFSAKIIVITARENEDGQLADAYRAGADDVYRKSMGNHILEAKFRSLARKFAEARKMACRLSTLESRMEAFVTSLNECSTEKDGQIAALGGALTAMAGTMEQVKKNTEQTVEIITAWNQAKAFVGFIKAVGSATAAAKWPILATMSLFASITWFLKTGELRFIKWEGK